jgi:hypothetical protein
MKTYEFSIIASGLDPRADDFEARFYDAGCDDATVSFQKGHIIVDFAREAKTVDAALSSAIKDVMATGATVEHVEPDPLVSMADIACRSRMTRAAITQYSKGQRGKDFPAPVARITSDNPLWDWAAVAEWLFRRKKLPREAVIEAQTVKAADEAIKSGRRAIGPLLKRRIDEYDAAL